MGKQTWSTWIVCQLGFATLLSLASCGSAVPDAKTLQKGQAANLKIQFAPVYDFGIQPINTSTEVTFTVTNHGNWQASEITGSFYLSTAYSFKGGGYPGEGGDCATDLLPQSSCTVVVV